MGVSLSLVAIGVLLAHVIEAAAVSPAVRSALLTPWWLLYATLTLCEAARHRAKVAGAAERPDRIVRWSAALFLITLSAAAAIAVFSIQLAYYAP